MDILRKKSRTRPQSPSSHDSRLANDSGLQQSEMSQSLQGTKKSDDYDFKDINQLLDIIENQRGALEQRAAIIKQLQSDISAIGKLLVEERSKAAQYQQMYVLVEKELDELKQQQMADALVMQSQSAQLPIIEKKLAQENYILKTDLDNIQHQLSLKSRESEDLHRLLEKVKRGQQAELPVGIAQVAELNSRMEEYENISELLQSQVVWLNKDNARLANVVAEKEAKCKEIETKLQSVLIESSQKSDIVDKLNTELAKQKAELEKRTRELKEAKEAMGYFQHLSDRSSFQLKLSTYNEEDLKRKIQYFKTEALSIADKLGNAQKDRLIWEEKWKQQQTICEEFKMSMDLMKREMAEERSRHRKEIDEAHEDLKIHYNSMQELEAELHKRGEGFERLGVTLKAKQSAMDQLTEELLRLKAENESLRIQLKDSEPVIRKAKDSALELETELTRAEIQIADYEHIQQENGVLKHRCFNVEKEVAELKKEIESLHVSKRDLEAQLMKSQTDTKLLEESFKGLKLELQEALKFQLVCQQLHHSLQQAEEDKKNLSAALEKKTKDHSNANMTIGELRRTIDQQYHANSDLKEIISKLKQQLEAKYPEIKEIQDKLDLLQRRDEELKSALVRINNATRAVESDLICIVCLSIVEDSVVCIPCGHFFCKRCREGYHPHCQQCGQGKKVRMTLKIGVIDDIATKIRYKRKVMSTLG